MTTIAMPPKTPPTIMPTWTRADDVVLETAETLGARSGEELDDIGGIEEILDELRVKVDDEEDSKAVYRK